MAIRTPGDPLNPTLTPSATGWLVIQEGAIVGRANPPALQSPLLVDVNAAGKGFTNLVELVAPTLTANSNLLAAHVGKKVPVNSASAVTITLVALSASDMGVGATARYVQEGAGAVGYAVSGVTARLVPSNGSATTTGPGDFIVIQKTDVTTYDVFAGAGAGASGVATQIHISGAMAATPPSGVTWLTDGNVTNIPISTGWNGVFRNASGAGVSLVPAAGSVIYHGNVAGGVTLINLGSCYVEGDGVNLFISGDVL